MSGKRSRPCATCADLKAKAKAVRAAEKRVEAAYPLCPCHNYRRTFCIAPSTDAWWTKARRAELDKAQAALIEAREAFNEALHDLTVSVT